MQNKRRVDYDVIRTLAIFLVILSHAMGSSPFFFSVLNPASQMLGIAMNKIAVWCVPLFLLLTGALCHNKTDFKAYYRRQIPIVLTYLFWTVVVLAFNIVFMDADFTVETLINYFLGYGSQDRVWYLDMYFGLVLMVPFLNIAWNHMEYKEKKILLLVLFILGPVTNLLKLIGEKNALTIIGVSDYYINVWCILYYFLGAFLDEYRGNFSGKKIRITFFCTFFAQVVLYFVAGYGKPLNVLWIQYIYHYVSPLCVILSALLFACLSGITIKNQIIVKIVGIISKVSFDMYLVSIITDEVANRICGVNYGRMSCLVVIMTITVVSFFMSFAIAFIKNLIWDREKWR